MWLLLGRTHRPDVPYWPGRRACAAIDAVGWPLAWIVATMNVRDRGGLVGALVVAVASIAAIRRLARAVWGNHRYYFTVWRWGRIVLCLLLIAWAVKWTLVARS